MTTKTESYRAIDVDEVPADAAVMPGVTYIETEPGADRPWIVAMLCPCGCGTVFHVHLRGSNSDASPPLWDIERHNGTISLSPSIHVNRLPGSCGAHFWLRRGQVEWC